MRSWMGWRRTVAWGVLALGVTAITAIVGSGLINPSVAEEIGSAAASKIESVQSLGRRIPPLLLDSPEGKPVGLYDFRDSNLLVVTFINTSCPISNKYVPILNELTAKFKDRKVQFIAINSQSDDSAAEIAQHAKEYKLAFPVLCDPNQVAVDVFGATRTSETFVLDPQKRIRYQGRIDDRITYSATKDNPTRADLELALEDLLAERSVATPSTDVSGCKLTRTRRVADKGQVTWSNDVAAIVKQRCENCHHPKSAAPFSLQSYAEARSWGEMIKEVVQQRTMPPWHADSRFGDFHDERKMTQREIDTLVAWVDDGMPAGDLSKAPQPTEFVDGWRIGKPDVVFELPEEVTIPAKGTVPYLYFETPTNFTEDMWIEAAEARPGNRSAVHHIILYYKLPGEQSKRDFREHWIDGAAPGNSPLMFPAGIGRKIPAGSTLVWEMHYTATGKEEKDRSQYAFKFHKVKPDREAVMVGITNNKFEIPAGDPNHKVMSKFKLPFNAKVLAYAPHMHVRGKDFEYKAIYPDGRTETLMSLPLYDFNWQTGYGLKDPLRLPKGTVLECTAHFDNSAGNPHNPDPKEVVRWGDQTWQEMMIGFIDLVPVD